MMINTDPGDFLLANEFRQKGPLRGSQRIRKSHRHFRYKGKRKRTDFILAAKNEIDTIKELHLQTYFRNLRKKRLKISESILSTDRKTLFWHIHAPFDVLCDTAEDLNVRLPTQENDIVISVWYDKALQRIKNWWDVRDPFKIKDSEFQYTKSFFADKFDKTRINEFQNGDDHSKLFSQTERSRLVSYILECTSFENDKPTQIGKSILIEQDVLTAAFPCHDGPLLKDMSQPCVNDRQKLNKEWASFRRIFKYQPLDAIMGYFGVKVAFYYAWLGFYITFLIPASVIGFLCFLYGCASNAWYEPVKEICNVNKNTSYFMCPLCDRLCPYRFLEDSCIYARFSVLFDNELTVLFAVFMSVWSIVYLEYWKRRQWTLAYKWHTMEFNEEEVVRPEFRAVNKKLKPNQVTGKLEPSLSRREYFVKLTGAFSVVFFFIALVIGALIGVIVYRAAIYGALSTYDGKLRANSKMFVSGTAALINLVVINILRLVYRKLAVTMTNWENPRTRSAYERSFTLKMFWFQFCNTYASVFYVAFFKTEYFIGHTGRYNRFSHSSYRLEGCSAQGCFLELCVQLIILMVGQQLFGNIAELLIPYARKKYNAWKNSVRSSRDVSGFEADYQLIDQDQLSLFWEYQEGALQYGFVTMFVAAFPLAPLIALMTNLVELRIDAINMIKYFRRPVAYKSDGIGVWYEILATITALGVLVNGFVLSITSEFIPRQVYKYQFSPDGSLKGYVNWSLSTYNVSYFQDMEKPENPTEYVKVVEETCRYPGFHESTYPFNYTIIYWEIMTIRLIFAFLFQWAVTATSRILAWIIPDRPKVLNLKIKRQEFLAQEALRRYKIEIGNRKPERENTDSEEELDESDREPDSDDVLTSNNTLNTQNQETLGSDLITRRHNNENGRRYSDIKNRQQRVKHHNGAHHKDRGKNPSRNYISKSLPGLAQSKTQKALEHVIIELDELNCGESSQENSEMHDAPFEANNSTAPQPLKCDDLILALEMNDELPPSNISHINEEPKRPFDLTSEQQPRKHKRVRRRHSKSKSKSRHRKNAEVELPDNATKDPHIDNMCSETASQSLNVNEESLERNNIELNCLNPVETHPKDSDATHIQPALNTLSETKQPLLIGEDLVSPPSREEKPSLANIPTHEVSPHDLVPKAEKKTRRHKHGKKRHGKTRHTSREKSEDKNKDLEDKNQGAVAFSSVNNLSNVYMPSGIVSPTSNDFFENDDHHYRENLV